MIGTGARPSAASAARIRTVASTPPISGICTSGSGVVHLEGDDAVLTPKSALSLSLALHELATNAAKFGSLSRAEGQVSVSWRVAENGSLVLTWREIGGPTVIPPTRRGFGSGLIERALAMETGGRATIDYAPTGVVCEIMLPKSALVEIGDRTLMRVEPSEGPVLNHQIPDKPRLLIVEDSYLVILTLEAMCEELSWTVVGPATRLDEAITLARTGTFDAALLDVNLDGEMSWDVAGILKDRGIPFAFSTGYDQANIFPDHLVGSPILAKPYSMVEVESRLRRMMSLNASEETV